MPLPYFLLSDMKSYDHEVLTVCNSFDVQIAHQPSIYVLDTPGVLVPSIQDIETGLKLALAGCF